MAGEQKRIDFNLGTAFRAVEALQLSGTVTAVFKAILACGPSSFPSVPELGRRTGFSDRSIQRAVHYLASLKLLRIHSRQRPDGSTTSNRYEATATIFDAGPVTACHPPVTDCHPPGDSLSPPSINPIETLTKPPSHETHGVQEKKENRKTRRIDFGRPISREDLANDFALQIFFRKTVAWLPDKWQDTPTDRRWFRLLAAQAREKDNPGGWFNAALANKRPLRREEATKS